MFLVLFVQMSLQFLYSFLITCCLLNWCYYGAILSACFNKKCYFIMYSTAIMNCLYPYVTAANPPSSRTRHKKAFCSLLTGEAFPFPDLLTRFISIAAKGYFPFKPIRMMKSLTPLTKPDC